MIRLMKRVGIVGSRTYTNRRKIKEFVYKLKEQFGEKGSKIDISGGHYTYKTLYIR